MGQEKLKTELNYLCDDIEKGNHHNILFRAPSGYGKTILSFVIANNLIWDNCYYQLPNEYGVYVDATKKLNIIDEVHTLKVPEMIYPDLDSKKTSFILCSNESGILKEPIRNRCIQFIFEPYTEINMKQIIENGLFQFNLPNIMITEIASRCKLVPRNAKVLCERLTYTFSNRGIPKSIEEMKDILENILQIKSGGLTNLDLRYINYMERVGRSSLQNICNSIGADKETVMTEIEPFLLYKNLIRITSRGREYVS